MEVAANETEQEKRGEEEAIEMAVAANEVV